MLTYMLLSVTLTLLIFCIFLQIKKERKIIFKEEEYLIAIKQLTLTIEAYKTTILQDKIISIQRTHNTDKNSQFNAIAKVEKLQHDLLAESAKELLQNYINSKLKTILAKYFSADALTLFVITNLKG